MAEYKSYSFAKTQIELDDGRYLIYYEFPSSLQYPTEPYNSDNGNIKDINCQDKKEN